MKGNLKKSTIRILKPGKAINRKGRKVGGCPRKW